ncbi:hypothetical protein D8674_004378 [Pyrus ussuriensis x Pyrus communis]|uniref:Uncharacterized protein n=1 Tax=Pyrus ussuriensis x Pyrus communis TaxID=2448454 RepID=A0A5N5FKC5_9ROSA|nr:hypothetical protein D8674_004378 [Pyrus ussuriensis x Pyrus communis]
MTLNHIALINVRNRINLSVGSADFGSKLQTAQNELENEPYILGKLRMSIFWSISRIVNIIFLEEVMAVLTLNGSQEAEQFVTDKKALKAINPINLAAKIDAVKNKPVDTYSNIRGNGIKDEDYE